MLRESHQLPKWKSIDNERLISDGSITYIKDRSSRTQSKWYSSSKIKPFIIATTIDVTKRNKKLILESTYVTKSNSGKPWVDMRLIPSQIKKSTKVARTKM